VKLKQKTRLRDIKLMNRHLLVRKCINDHIRDSNGDVLIYKPDEMYETTNWAQILDVADDCKEFTKDHVGCLIECPEYGNFLHRLGDYGDSEDFLVKEDEIMERHPFIVEM